MRGALVADCLLVCHVLAASAAAQELWLTDQRGWPRIVVVTRDGRTPHEVFRRALTPPRGASDAVPRVQALAVADGGRTLYYASGLDRYIFRSDAGREVHLHTHPAQVRDLALSPTGDELWYSVVPTPRDDEPLPEGELFALHLRTKEQRRIRPVLQADLQGPWWGSFAVHEGQLYIATLARDSLVYRLTDGGAELVYRSDVPILGFAFGRSGDLFFTGSDGGVYHSPDLRERRVVRDPGPQRWSDLNVGRD